MIVGPVGGTRTTTGLYFDPKLEGVTYTTGATGSAGYGGAEAGAAPAAGMILGPWASDSAAHGRGDTTATEEGDDKCCCCCPCDPCDGNTLTKGETITSSPVDASRATGGMVITGGRTPPNVLSGPRTQFTESGPHFSAPGFDTDSMGHPQTMASGPQARPMTQPQVISVPGYNGPLSTYAQATSSAQASSSSSKGKCGCGCKGNSAPSPGTEALPPIPAALADTDEESPYTDVVEVAPAASGTVLARTILAGPTDGAKFASYSRDLLADVLTVSAASASRGVPAPGIGVATLSAAVVRTVSPATVSRTISG